MKKIRTHNLLLLLLCTQLFGAKAIPLLQQLPSYYVAPIQDLTLLTDKLQHNGFTILATTKILENNHIVTITNKELQSTNSYMATLQINVNPHSIHLQNPAYLAAAYLGKHYSDGQFQNTIDALKDALDKLDEGPYKVDASSLENYCFMYGLPTKQDILRVKKSSNLIEKISDDKSEEFIAYSLTLPNGSILVGHKLREKTNDFLKLLREEENAQILPYEAMINGDEVTIMNPKYYLSLSFPQLTLEEFIQIASVPDNIYRNIKQAYK